MVSPLNISSTVVTWPDLDPDAVCQTLKSVDVLLDDTMQRLMFA